ncbi:MAG: 1-deoxy-D-xylulose-5-phosphate synthase [Bacteroidales bacterium]|nr:1-deoxy-D-xylulose-5-phosphate synthase [Bacteroidales bacterium]
MSKETKTESNVSTRLLDRIQSPADLRKLPVEALPQLCAEIREFLIDKCSTNPGHFASSMGAVEITVALHYVYDTPYDRLVWDVGHQAYGHKLLTGRRDRFDTNRTLGGISGFPTPSESEYDTFTAGHASNSISAALGMAVASRLKDEKPRNVVAVIGDASVSGGLAFEGINNAANTPNNLLIVLNDNDMSIDRNVGSLNSYLAHLTTSKGYNKLRYRTYRILKRLHLVTERSRGRIMRFNNSLKSLLVHEQNLFEGLNIRYFGPFDGHDVIKIVRVLTDIRDMEGPRLLHLRTVKGKGYAPAEADPAKWHAPGKFDPKTGARACDKISDKPCPPKFQDVFGQTLLELARKDERIVGITAAMPSGTSMSVMQAALPDRVFDVGISEGHAVTFAGGLAKDGMLPFVAIYSSFLQRAYDHIIHDVAIQNLPVTFGIDRAGLVGEDGMTHHGALDIAYLRTVPNMTISAPADEQTLRDLMFTAATGKFGPFAIRYPRGAGECIDWKGDMHELPVGKGRRITDGDDVAVLTVGTVCADASRAIRDLAAEGVKAAHYDMIFVKPIDEDILAEVAGKGCPIVTVEDGTVNGGMGSAVADYMLEHGFAPRIVRLGIPDKYITQGTPAQLKRLCGIDAQGIADGIRKALAKS